MKLSPTRLSRGARLRHGWSLTELAVCLPILSLLVLATIETSSTFYLKQSLATAAYEGARVGLLPHAQTADIQDQAETVLVNRNVRSFTINVTPGLESAAAGAFFRVEVSAERGANSLVGDWVYNGRTLTSYVEMMKEVD